MRVGAGQGITPADAGLQAPASPPAFSLNAPNPAPRRARPGLWSSIALRFSGFQPHLEALIAPLKETSSPLHLRSFFAEKLPQIADMAGRNPVAAHRLIAANLGSTAHPWRDLVLVACGDGSAMAPALDALEHAGGIDPAALTSALLSVARLRPAEGRHLIRHAFSHAQLSGQLAILSALTVDASATNTTFVGELFVKMMEGASQAERTGGVYPALFRLLASEGMRRSPRAGFLAACLRGWLTEGHDNGHADRARLRQLDALIV